MSLGYFFVLYSGLSNAFLRHGFVVWIQELEGLVNVRGVLE